MKNNEYNSVSSILLSKPFIGILLLFSVISLLNIPVLITLWRHGFDDGTYSHAYLIPFISLFLYYKLAYIGKLQFREKITFAATLPLLLSCYLLFLTTTAQLSVGYWFSFLLVTITSVTLLYRFNWYIVFPAAFLIFIMPFWGILTPILQNMSLAAVHYMMAFSGVPTFVEEQFVTIPAGVFEIAGGCSGLRYLIVSLAISSLFIFLYIKAAKRAALFLTIAILGALLTNWIRITALILIGEYTNMQSSLMADHNTFGWYLYIPFMVLLFIWGNKLVDIDLINTPKPQTSSQAEEQLNKTLISTLLLSLLLSSTSLINGLKQIPKINTAQIEAAQLISPKIHYFTSMETIIPLNIQDGFISTEVTYQIYHFNGSDLDGKPTFFGNDLIPKEWSSSSQIFINNWSKQEISNGREQAILFTHYKIDGIMVPDGKTFKIVRLAKAALGIIETQLHWSIFMCKTTCPENILPPEI